MKKYIYIVHIHTNICSLFMYLFVVCLGPLVLIVAEPAVRFAYGWIQP